MIWMFYYSNAYQVFEALQLLLMVVLGPHDLDKVFEQDHTKFPLQDSPHDSIVLIGSSFYHVFQDFQIDCFKYQDQIASWIEESYLENFVSNNKF